MNYAEVLARRANPPGPSIGGYYRSAEAFSETDRYVIVDGETQKTIQSEFSKTQADKCVKVLNDHEISNNRKPVYYAEEITK